MIDGWFGLMFDRSPANQTEKKSTKEAIFQQFAIKEYFFLSSNIAWDRTRVCVSDWNKRCVAYHSIEWASIDGTIHSKCAHKAIQFPPLYHMQLNWNKCSSKVCERQQQQKKNPHTNGNRSKIGAKKNELIIELFMLWNCFSVCRARLFCCCCVWSFFNRLFVCVFSCVLLAFCHCLCDTIETV